MADAMDEVTLADVQAMMTRVLAKPKVSYPNPNPNPKTKTLKPQNPKTQP